MAGAVIMSDHSTALVTAIAAFVSGGCLTLFGSNGHIALLVVGIVSVAIGSAALLSLASIKGPRS